jgi:hypothetical protein
MKFEKFKVDYEMGYIIDNIPQKYLNILKDNLKDINIHDPHEHYNSNLVSGIQREFKLSITDNEFLNYLFDLGLILDANLNGSIDELSLLDVWVNYQLKYEFNPLHSHSGKYSFVIWYDIPFLIENELTVFPGTRQTVTSNFCFAVPHNSKISYYPLPVDKTWNGKIAIFPSSLNHCVYPFYTSNEYRITIAGNLI